MDIQHKTAVEMLTDLCDIEDEVERIRAKLSLMPPNDFHAALARLDVLEAEELLVQDQLRRSA